MNSFSAMQKAIDFEMERQVGWSLAISHPAPPYPALVLLVRLNFQGLERFVGGKGEGMKLLLGHVVGGRL